MSDINYEKLFETCLDYKGPLPHPDVEAALVEDSTRSARVRQMMDALRAVGARLHGEDRSATEVVEAISDMADHVVMGLFRSLAVKRGLESKGVVVYALGGYGRRELNPYSDLDMLILHDDGVDMGTMVQDFLYPLWDSGMEVQAVARTIRENVQVAREDHRSRTNLLEARFLGGDRELNKRFEKSVLEKEVFKRGRRNFVKLKVDEMFARYERFGDTVYLVEPNVKEGQGCLRDIHTAFWVAKLCIEVRSIREIADTGIIPPEELTQLKKARNFLLKVRNFLHYNAGRRDDRLTWDSQVEFAKRYGYEQPEDFLGHFYVCANRVKHFTELVIRRACRGVVNLSPDRSYRPTNLRHGLVLYQGELDLEPEAVKRDPLNLLRLFQASQRADAPPSPQAMKLLRENLHLVDDRFRRDPRAVEIFLSILQFPRRVATTLMRMHDARLLDRFIPELGNIFCLVSRELNHIYPVDVHSLIAVQYLRRLLRGEYEDVYWLATELMREHEKRGMLFIAALLHDVGKGMGGHHCERGAEVALAVGERMGFPAEDREMLIFLVRNHLILSATAQGRDLEDDELIHDFAQRVGSVEALKSLFLLTFADIMAVAPDVMNAWKMMLLEELYRKTYEVLDEGVVAPPSLAERSADAASRLREAARGVVEPGVLEEFLVGVDHPQYMLSYPVKDLLRHAQAWVERGEGAKARIRPVENEGYSEVIITCPDRPGVFADIAGLTAAQGLNVLSAALNTRRDGWVIDVLHITDAAGEMVSPDDFKYRNWLKELDNVTRGGIDVAEMMAKRALSHKKRVIRSEKPTVTIDNEASRRFTVIDVTARDRLGLLYDIASCLAALGLNIRVSKIATTLERATDSFYVEMIGTGKITDEKSLSYIRKELLKAIGES